MVFEEKERNFIDEDQEAMTGFQKDFNSRKMEQAKTIIATKEKLFARKKRLFEVKVPIDEEEDGTPIVMSFKVRRLSHEERSSMKKFKPYEVMNIYEMSEEDMESMSEQGYEVLAKIVVEPKLSLEEWKEVDVALTQALITQISLLQYETSDAAIVNELKNL
jgi:hypothetical protein